VADAQQVLEAAVVGIPDERWGERPLLVVVLRPEHRCGVLPALPAAWRCSAASMV
jgi:acyl-CoA synthetase (AMP-forming)/AMP-acid ligase II